MRIDSDGVRGGATGSNPGPRARVCREVRESLRTNASDGIAAVSYAPSRPIAGRSLGMGSRKPLARALHRRATARSGRVLAGSRRDLDFCTTCVAGERGAPASTKKTMVQCDIACLSSRLRGADQCVTAQTACTNPDDWCKQPDRLRIRGPHAKVVLLNTATTTPATTNTPTTVAMIQASRWR